MQPHPYASLTPDVVMDAIESLGFVCDARVFPLNSYENRVYQVGLEDEQPIIAKFYRPQRWSEAALREEHGFMLDLQEDDIPVVAPIMVAGETLFQHADFHFVLFPRRGGHAPEFSSSHDLELLGRWLGRLHQTGVQKTFRARARLEGRATIEQSVEQVLSSQLMPTDYNAVYESLWPELASAVEQQLDTPGFASLRLHGDLHCGNLLLRDEQLWMVDFDDCLQGPAMQDIWMLLSGQREEQLAQLDAIRNGYEMFRPFPYQELSTIEALRTVRVMKYAAWLCQRWDDPAFPLAFPWFEGHRFWSEHILTLREQLAALQQEPLTLFA